MQPAQRDNQKIKERIHLQRHLEPGVAFLQLLLWLAEFSEHRLSQGYASHLREIPAT